MSNSTAAAAAPAKIYQYAAADGAFHRQVSSFRDHISSDPGARFTAEKGRYHLYVSLACPWAHRTLLVRALKGLEEMIDVSVVHYHMGPDGWRFAEEAEKVPGCVPDTVNHAKFLSEIYRKAEPGYNARFTVPVLWDKKENTIVNNESAEIVRILNCEFNSLLQGAAKELDLYPEALRAQIDETNTWVYDTVNNGVYKTGFASKQEVYEENCRAVFKSLDRLEAIFAEHKYLVGDRLTEADIRLFTTIVRFDPVYVGHFKCNLSTIEHGYPNILTWARRIYQLPGLASTVNMEHIKKHYYTSHKHINPNSIVPLSNGPDLSNPKVEA